MAEKDMTEKALIACNDVFADIVNNLVFEGREMVAESELEQALSREVYLGESGFRELERDVSKYWKRNDIRIALLGVENETEPEDDMPIRVIGYDGASYRDQIRYEQDTEGKRRKVAERYPVITLVLYFGYKQHWNKARTLHEALGDHLDPRLAGFVSDYRINLIEIAYLTEEQVQGFHSDFKYVADYFVQMRRTGVYTGSREEMRHVREVLQLMATLTGDNRFAAVAEPKQGNYRKGGIHNMSEALDLIETRGYNRGYDQGIEQGFGRGEETHARKVTIAMYKRGIPVEEIADILEEDINTIHVWLLTADD